MASQCAKSGEIFMIALFNCRAAYHLRFLNEYIIMLVELSKFNELLTNLMEQFVRICIESVENSPVSLTTTIRLRVFTDKVIITSSLSVCEPAVVI